jgi:hypothetical protein
MFLSRCSLVAVLATAFLSAPAAAGDDKNLLTTPTGWAWYYGQTDAQIDALVATGLRIVDLDVESTSPYRFTAAFVRNTGEQSYSTWWWRYGYDLAQMQSFLANNNARMIDLQPYDVGGSPRYAFVAIPNTGANAKAWWYYWGTTTAFIGNHLTTNNARLVELERYTIGNNTYFSGISIRNAGADAKTWWWYPGVTQQQLVGYAQQNNAVPYDLDRTPQNTFDAILVRSPGTRMAWYFNVAEATINNYLSQYGMRPVEVDRNGSSFDALMVENLDALSQSINDQMRALTDGNSGFLLRRINGSTVAGLRSTFVFEPASLLKTLHHAHAMRRVWQAQTTLQTNLNVTSGLPTDCPNLTATFPEQLQDVLRAMMENSDNRRTRAVTDTYGGFAALNATATALGMGSTQVNHHIGCGTPANEVTLADLAELHDRIASGYVGAQRQNFYDFMSNGVTSFAGSTMGTVLNEEAASVGLTATQFAAFKARIEMAHKGGSYGISGESYRSLGGWVSIPFYQNHQIVPREYFVGAFVEKSTSGGTNASNAINLACSELLRQLMHDAMLTWKTYQQGSILHFGSACAGTPGQPLLTASGTPEIGEQVTIQLSNALALQPAALIIGTSNTAWNAIPLPLDMGPFGAPGCRLLTNPLVQIAGVNSLSGTQTRVLQLPLDPGLIGGQFHAQYLTVDAAANALKVVFTRGATTQVGGG